MQLRAATRDKSPHQQDENCAHDAGDEASSLTSLIPAEGLSEVGRDQGTDNAKGSSENEALGLMHAMQNGIWRQGLLAERVSIQIFGMATEMRWSSGSSRR